MRPRVRLRSSGALPGFGRSGLDGAYFGSEEAASFTASPSCLQKAAAVLP
jgi:hypothetical protein